MARSKDVANNTNRPGQRSTNDRDDDDHGRNERHDDDGARHVQGRSDHKSDKDDRSSRRDDDSRDDSHGKHGKHDSHEKHGSHGKHESCGKGRDDDDRYAVELDLDKRHDGIDLEVEVEQDGRWLEVEIEIGSIEIELKVDARQLQPDTSPVVAMLGGEGTAIGEETLVDAEIFSRLIDFGSVTVAFGTADFACAAVANGGMAFAAADTFADVAGADLVLVFNEKVSSSADGSVSYATERSTTSFVAIDFEDFDFGEGPLVLDSQYALAYFDQLCGRAPAIDGNVAILDVDAQALSENTLVDVMSSILTVEDQLSTVSAMTVSAVG